MMIEDATADVNLSADVERVPAAAAAPAETQPETRRGGSRDPKVFVLLRELSEVHLLLDNVSANPTTTVSELRSGTPPAMLEEDWIEKVCKISWPPDGSNEDKAEDAALLIRAKDYLNRLSHPASGSTIAFTLLVTQDDDQKKSRRKSGADANSATSPTRSSLARAAYPDLIAKAAGFRKWMMLVSASLLFALLLTCLLSWYVAYGNAALAELATAQQSLSDARTRVNEAEIAETAQAPGPSGEQGRPGRAAVPARPATPYVGYCEALPYRSPGQAQLCEARVRAEGAVSRVERRLASWRCWKPFSDCGGENARVPGASDSPSRAAAFANIMGSAVLPFLYGLLGAGAAVIRSLSRKIRASLLSPRDLHLSLQQLALGAVVGACIGLFIAAPGSNASGETLLGPVTLSASAISFIAGFGVEAVFQALEALITRIFNITAVPTGNRGDGVPGN